MHSSYSFLVTVPDVGMIDRNDLDLQGTQVHHSGQGELVAAQARRSVVTAGPRPSGAAATLLKDFESRTKGFAR